MLAKIKKYAPSAFKAMEFVELMRKKTMTEEKKLSSKERYDLINQKIDEIKKLADDCVLLVHVDDASTEANTLLVGKGKAGYYD